MQALLNPHRIVAARGHARRSRKILPRDAGAHGPAASAIGQAPGVEKAEPRTAFMFAGEGSQYFQMGGDLYKRYQLFRRCMQETDQLVRELSGYSVIKLLYEEGYTKSETFDRTLLSHPAIFMVQYATSRVLIDAGIGPEMTIGTGVGSFAAAVIADFLPVEQAMIALIRQASMFESCCRPGGMLAVLQDPRLYDPALLEESEIACFNLPRHFVVAAEKAPLLEIEEAQRARGITVQKLAVPFAFHSRWIDEARDPFERFMRSIEVRRGRIPTVSGFAPEALTELPPDYFWRVMREPIRFHDTIAALESKGTFRYIDIGPSATLSTMVTRALDRGSASTAAATLTPFGRDLKNIAALIENV